ncbi:MAG: hypothetical protein F4X44_02860 [Gammaproteobacteria bacterium]|nr:hypothetical protein [Gammaproteobacteria bacterium]MYD79535.1 hypothetical protein [Gammaproteobacteria bacterium]
MSSSVSQKVRTVGFVAIGLVVGAVLATVVFMALPGSNDQLEESLVEGQPFSTDGNEVQTGAAKSGIQTSNAFGDFGAVGDLGDISTIESAFERTFKMHGFLMGADESQLNEHLTHSSEIATPSVRDEFQSAVAQRLAEFNPQRALKSIRSLPNGQDQALLATVFGEWSRSDLDGALAQAKTLSESERLAALNGILTSRGDLSDSLQQQIAKQLGHEQYAMQTQSSATVGSSGGDPRDAWNALVNDSYEDIAQIGSLVQIAQSLVQQNGMEALDWIRNSLIDDTVLEATVRSVLHHVALSDPQSAFRQAQSLTRDSQDVALPTIVEMWARSNPLVAMDTLSNLKNASQRSRLQTTLFRAWAESDPQDLFDSLERLPEAIRSKAEQQAMLAVARTAPSDAVAYLADLPAGDRQRDLALEIAEHWSKSDIYAALDWVLSDQISSESTRRRALTEVLRNLVDVDPTLAFQTALKQEPLTKYGRGLEAMVIEQIARSDIDTAISLLSQVRAGRTKLHAYIAAGRALVQNGGYDRALRLGQQLPNEDQSRYRHSVLWSWAESDPEGLLASLEELPSEDAKTQAAMGLIMSNFRHNALSGEQMEYVSSMLPKGSGNTYSFTTEGGGVVSTELSEQVSARMMQVIEQTLADRAVDITVDGAEPKVIFMTEEIQVSNPEVETVEVIRREEE